MKPIVNRLFLLTGLIASSLQAGLSIVNYTLSGANWGGLCATSKKQSPIDIPQFNH